VSAYRDELLRVAAAAGVPDTNLPLLPVIVADMLSETATLREALRAAEARASKAETDLATVPCDRCGYGFGIDGPSTDWKTRALAAETALRQAQAERDAAVAETERQRREANGMCRRLGEARAMLETAEKARVATLAREARLVAAARAVVEALDAWGDMAPADLMGASKFDDVIAAVAALDIATTPGAAEATTAMVRSLATTDTEESGR
jgi:hypothetical protein